MEKQPSTRTINIDITDLIDDSQRCDIEGTVADSKVVFEIFKNLGIEHKSTSYMRMHKYGYQTAKDACPHIPASVLQDSAKEALSNLKAWNSKNKHKKWQYNGKKSNDSYPLNAKLLRTEEI